MNICLRLGLVLIAAATPSALLVSRLELGSCDLAGLHEFETIHATQLQLDEQDRVVVARIQQKEQVIDGLLAKRLSPRAAVDRFLELSRAAPKNLASFRLLYPDLDDDPLVLLSMLSHVRAQCAHQPGRYTAVEQVVRTAFYATQATAPHVVDPDDMVRSRNSQ